MRALVLAVLCISCASSKPIPSDPSERAAHFAQAVRDAVEAKGRFERGFDESIRQACSQVVALRAFLPAGQRIDDVDSVCKGYLSTEPPAPVVPKVEPVPTEEPAPVTDGGVPA